MVSSRKKTKEKEKKMIGTRLQRRGDEYLSTSWRSNSVEQLEEVVEICWK